MKMAAKPWSYVALAASALILAGCATQAMKQAQVINSGAATANAQMKSCMDAVVASPDHAAVADHQPKDATQPTLQQIADDTIVDDQQIRAIYALNQMAQECRKNLVTSYNAIEPGISLILMDVFQKTDDEALLLVQKKIAWGEYNKTVAVIAADHAKQFQAEAQRINAGLQQANNAEIEQRQRAAAAFARYEQNAQAIAAANRPVVTNCNSFGNSVNCVTH